MFTGIRVGRLAGIPFFINPSWFFIFAFVTFTLATSELPDLIPYEQEGTYWLLGIGVALLFFGSLVAHELGHSLVSKAYGIPVRSITLHLFGGVAQLSKEVSRAREEFWIALAGPAVSIALCGVFWGLLLLLEDAAPLVATGFQLVAILNLGVAVFNMAPGFPLDGGRVLRAVVWGISGNYLKATRIASAGGRLMGSLLILAGVYFTLSTGDLGTLWLALIGWFLIGIARQSYTQAVVQDTLQRTPVSELTIRLIAVPSTLSVDELYSGYISTTGRQYYLVEVNGQPAGVVTPHALAQVPWLLRSVTPLLNVMSPLEELPEIESTATALSALQRMEESRAQLLRTLEDGQTVGVVTREQVLGLMMNRRFARYARNPNREGPRL